MTTDLAVRASVEGEISGFHMQPRSFEEALRYCEMMASSELVSKDYRGKPGNIWVAIQMGQELGLSPMRSLRCIAVINGRASMWGDDMLAMVQASPVCEYVYEQESTETEGVCRVKRKDEKEEHRSTFTLAQAKRAGYLSKAGSWTTHPDRMLKLRARGFALRDKFSDVLAGLITAEEAMDLPPIEPTDPKVNMIEASQPLTLKDKLKAKVENTSVLEPTVDEVMKDMGQGDGAGETQKVDRTQQASDAPAPLDDPAEPYRVKIKVAHDEKECNMAYAATPETLKQDVHGDYFAKLKELSKRKK